MKKALFVIFIFLILAMLQVSFLPHFSVAGWVPNIFLLSLVALAFFSSLIIGVEAALAGGFFLDLYSNLPFGSWMILSLILFWGVRHILRNYVRISQYI